jgi:hypothetical protein
MSEPPEPCALCGLPTAGVDVTRADGTQYCCRGCPDVDDAMADDDPRSVETMFDLSAAAGRRVKQNIGWAFCYNGIAIPVAVAVLLNPLFAAAAMGASSLLVVGNPSRSLVDGTDG